MCNSRIEGVLCHERIGFQLYIESSTASVSASSRPQLLAIRVESVNARSIGIVEPESIH